MSVAVNESATVSNQDSRIVLFDTNCFIKLYQSPVQPFFGDIDNVYRLLTLGSLINEFFTSPRLKTEYAWLQSTVRNEDRTKIELHLTPAELESINEIMVEHRDYVDDVLDSYCQNHGVKVSRRLSENDLRLLATAIETKSYIATDEWALAVVVNDLMLEPEEGYEIGILTSIDIISVLEEAKKLTSVQRVDTVKSWLRSGEILRRDWSEQYRDHFNEVAPKL